MPWIEHGMPSRNGITRTEPAHWRRAVAALCAATSSRTQRTRSAPPCQPSVESAAHTVPLPRSSRAAAASSSGSEAATTSLGARVIPARSHRPSTTVLSSRASHSGRRWARNGRPSSVGDSVRKSPTTTAVRSGSKRSSASRATCGRSATMRTLSRIAPSIPSPPASRERTCASSSAGGEPVPGPLVARTNTALAPRSRTARTIGVACTISSTLMITLRPANSGRNCSRQCAAEDSEAMAARYDEQWGRPLGDLGSPDDRRVELRRRLGDGG